MTLTSHCWVCGLTIDVEADDEPFICPACGNEDDLSTPVKRWEDE